MGLMGRLRAEQLFQSGVVFLAVKREGKGRGGKMHPTVFGEIVSHKRMSFQKCLITCLKHCGQLSHVDYFSELIATSL